MLRRIAATFSAGSALVLFLAGRADAAPATRLSTGAGFGPEVDLDSADNAASTPAVAFAHGCPTAIAVYQNTPSGNGSGVFALRLH